MRQRQRAASTLVAPLRSRSFATLFAGYALSAVGDAMAMVAISWLAIGLAHGDQAGLLVGAAVAAYTLPGVVAGFGLVRMLGRWDARSLVLSEAALRALALGLIALLDLLGILSPPVYIALLGISSLFVLLGASGDLGAVVELLPAGQHMAGNSLTTIAGFLASIVGPVIAGGVIDLDNAGAAIAADAGSYAVLAAAVLLSRHFQPPPSAPPTATHSILAGLRALGRQRAALGITVLCVTFFGLYGPVEVALPLYVSSVLHAGPGVLGSYLTLFSVGATIGALGTTAVQRFGAWNVAIASVAGWGACLIPFGFTDSVVVGLAALAVGGLVYGPFVPLKNTILQRASPSGSLTALVAASTMFTITASPVGAAVGGPLVAAIGPSATLLASGLATISAAIAGAIIWEARQRRRPTATPPKEAG